MTLKCGIDVGLIYTNRRSGAVWTGAGELQGIREDKRNYVSLASWVYPGKISGGRRRNDAGVRSRRDNVKGTLRVLG